MTSLLLDMNIYYLISSTVLEYAITPPIASPSPLPHWELLQLSGESLKSPTPSPQLAGDTPPHKPILLLPST